jgi:flagellar motor switch protein FliM
MADRILSQDEIDNVFRNLRDGGKEGDEARRAHPYDFRRPDRIAKDQLRSIHMLHENFARSVASSLSAFLRTFIVVNLISVEQLSFAEFVKCLPSPSCIVSLGVRPFEGNAILEIGHSLIFPIFEMLLGGSGKSGLKITREITEIEKIILDSVFRVILQDLKTAWQAVTFIDFAVDSHENDPQMLQILAPNEAVVAVSMEMKIGENSGLMNIGIPSIIIKMLRQKFDQQWNVRKSQSSESEYARILRLIKPSAVQLDVRLDGPTVLLADLMKLEEGDVLMLDYPVRKEINLILNGKAKYLGHVVTHNNKRGFQINHEYRPSA